MNLVKANIVGGASKGNILWVDKDSSLTHWNNGACVTTYKTYGFYYGCDGMKTKDAITSSDYHARIKKEFIELIEEEEPKPDPVSNKNSMFETIVTTYGDQPIFSVITVNGEMVRGDIPFEECEELISRQFDYDEYEIVMKIMETTTVKQVKPTI